MTMPKGLKPKTFKGGLNSKRIESRTGGGGGNKNSLQYKVGEMRVVQFFGKPSDDSMFMEFEQHQFRDGSRWNYVPCGGEGCPLCDHENDEVSKTRHRFVAAIWSFKDKASKILEGPNDLATRLIYRYKRAPERFTHRTFEVSKLKTEPVSYDVSVGEERAIRLTDKEPLDLEKYLIEQMERYYSANGDASSGPSTLDDDEDEDDEDIPEDDEDDEEGGEDPDEDEMHDMEWPDLKAYAREVGVRSDTRKRSELIRLILRKRA